MSVKPILFNTEMVRAILDGTKTCTRRVVRYKYSNTEMKIKKDKYGARLIEIQKDENSDGSTYQKLLPFVEKEAPYQPGDILYVRETWQKAGLVDDFDQVVDGTEKYYYAAGPEKPCFDYWVDSETGEHKERMPWRPSIHMPKEAARIWLKVTEVRVERLQDITGQGVLKEGLNSHVHQNAFYFDMNQLEMFENLWNSTIKKTDLDRYGWDVNPWVWVVEFERCEKPPECILKGYDKAPGDGLKCLGYMYDDNRDELLPMCEKCSYQESYEESEEEK